MKQSVARKKEGKIYMNTYDIRAAQRSPQRASEIT